MGPDDQLPATESPTATVDVDALVAVAGDANAAPEDRQAAAAELARIAGEADAQEALETLQRAALAIAKKHRLKTPPAPVVIVGETPLTLSMFVPRANVPVYADSEGGLYFVEREGEGEGLVAVPVQPGDLGATYRGLTREQSTAKKDAAGAKRARKAAKRLAQEVA